MPPGRRPDTSSQRVAAAAKRKRVSDHDDQHPRRTVARMSGTSTIPQRLERTSRASTSTADSPLPVTPTSADHAQPSRKRQVARRTGGAPRVNPDAAQMPPPPPRSRLVVEVEIPTRRSGAPNSSTFNESPSHQSQPRRRSTRRSTSSGSLESEEGGEVGTPGPGPRTRAHRQSRELGPVPEPSPSMFRQYLGSGRPSSSWQNDDEIVDPSSSASPPETQPMESLAPAREVTIINGEQAFVMAPDSDSGSDAVASPNHTYACPMTKCSQTLASPADLARHIRAHALMYDPTADENSVPAAAGADEGKKSELERLENEVARLQSSLAEVEGRAAAAVDQTVVLEAQLKEKSIEASLAREQYEEMGTKTSEEIQDLKLRLGERDVTIATLTAKLQAVEDVEEELSQLAASQESPDTEPLPVEQQIKLLHKKVKKKASALKSAQSDVDFFRDQYQNASTRAVQEVDRANKLEEEVKRLQDRLTLGLKQRDLHTAAAAKKHAANAKQSQMQLNLLLEQSRRTDDAVRKKASAHNRLIRENREFEAELHIARSKADELSKRNQELSEQVAILRGRVMGAFDPVESDDDTVDEPIDVPAPAMLVPSFAPDNVSTRPSPALADATLADGGIEAFRCKWALEGDVVCPEIFHTRDELEAHGLGHIDKLAIELGAGSQSL